MTRTTITAACNRRLAQWRVTWLVEHFTSHQLLWYSESFVLRIPPLSQAPKRYVQLETMAVYKKITADNELFLYMNGNLIYKRWLDTGQSKVFDIMAYDKYTLTSIRDLEYENPGGLISIKAMLTMKKTEDGGRQTGFVSGYRPNHVFEYSKSGQFLQTWIGDIIFDGQSTIEPGETKEVTVRFLITQPIEKYFDKGRKWWIHEGAKVVGEAVII